MPSCAGAYVLGPLSSNVCPSGSVRIETEAACRTAAAAAGTTFGSTSVDTDYPRGCYIWTTDNCAYFNPHAVGAGDASSRLLCAAVTTGAPPHRASVRARVYCAVLAGLAGGVHDNKTNGRNIETRTYISRYV